MSRIGEKPITIPEKVTVKETDGTIIVSGPKGELVQELPSGIAINISDNKLMVKRNNNSKQARAYHGLTRSLVANMIIGVTDGYAKKLELVGTGYRAKKQGQGVTIQAGYSHTVDYQPPKGIAIEPETETLIVISGIDKQQVGQVAAEIRGIRPPEPYKGKGIRYQGEAIRRKAGKAVKSA